MGDEDIGELQPLLQVGEKVHDLGLHRDVEGGDGLVEDDQLGIQRNGAGDTDALALAAGEFVRKAHGVIGLQADDVE